MWAVVSQTFREFLEDECPRLAASTAYYTFFSLPALLVAIVYIGGLVLVNHREDIEQRLQSHFEETIGSEGAKELTGILQHASHPEKSGPGMPSVGMPATRPKIMAKTNAVSTGCTTNQRGPSSVCL